VIIEQQMDNINTNIIASALGALFVKYKCIYISPKLKNKIKLNPEGDISIFRAQHVGSYAANKAHAKYNFAIAEKVFGSTIPHSSATARGHIADSFMQCLAFVILKPIDESLSWNSAYLQPF
jgi:hypothetical protein